MDKQSPTCGNCGHTRYYHAKGGCLHGFQNYMEMAIQNRKAGRELMHGICECKEFNKLEVKDEQLPRSYQDTQVLDDQVGGYHT